jgi:small-conductance mechanosensitive channel
LFLSYSLYEWTWVMRPLVIAFAVITLAGVAWSILRPHREAQHGPRSARADLMISAAFLAIAVAVLVEARGWPFRTSVFPLATGWLLAGLAAAKLVRGFRPTSVEAPPGVEEEAELLVTAGRAQWLPALGWMAAFFIMLWLLGALITVPLFTLVYLLLASRESPVLAGACALASWVFIYGLFDRLLRVPLP